MSPSGMGMWYLLWIYTVNIYNNSVGNYNNNDSVELCGYVPQILHRQNSVLMYKYCVNLWTVLNDRKEKDKSMCLKQSSLHMTFHYILFRSAGGRMKYLILTTCQFVLNIL
jgi:hypothetical protein